ncbi:MAG TPA: alanine--tRNA ligase, partial [Candidatus Paenibacillus intestinavium]|nr:alanine--tRNA ligase [Candidatus Paenibacillus intestinavium]
DGSYTPLPNKNIDTGAGLERLASILQDVDSNFDTDLFMPIIKRTCEIAGVTYKVSEDQDVALKVIADHVRTVVFSVGDGVMPSNEGRGYIIRRLLRRAVRYGKALGVDKPFLYGLTGIVGDVMGVYYPEVVEKREFIEKVIRTEEERFHETLSDGLVLLSNLVDQAKASKITVINGEDAFKLYDTYGFPFDLTEDFAMEQGMTVDRDGFDAAMQAQRERARSARQDTASMKIQGGPLADLTIKSEFVGYTELVVKSTITALVGEELLLEEAVAGTQVLLLLDKTPFYAESGGQIGDRGTITGEGFVIEVENVTKAPHGQTLHHAIVVEGVAKVNAAVTAQVNKSVREDVVKNHTATHLLHKALKEVLGEHVNQAGSLVEGERLRFDFSHFGSITAEELVDIERRVNEQIWLGTPVVIEQKKIDEAKAMGAMALFGEKYGDVVRVVQVGQYSIELCGGCHVNNTSEIGLFKLLSESGIGSGVRRIEAVTGKQAYLYYESQLDLLKQAASQLKSNVADVPKRIDALNGQVKELIRDNESLQHKLSHIEAGSLLDAVVRVGEVSILTAKVNASNMESLRSIVDELKTKLPTSVIVLGAAAEDKVNLAAAVSQDLVKKGFHAGKIIKEAAQLCGGNGGGRPDMAQAGGKDVEKLNDALKLAQELVVNQANVI